jgi:hypothetical protein
MTRRYQPAPQLPFAWESGVPISHGEGPSEDASEVPVGDGEADAGGRTHD